MRQTLAISDELYSRLQEKARKFGVNSVEQFLEKTLGAVPSLSDEELRRRQEAGHWADLIRARVEAKCGLMPDSTPLIREDRERGRPRLLRTAASPSSGTSRKSIPMSPSASSTTTGRAYWICSPWT